MNAQEKLVQGLVEEWLHNVEHDGFEITGVERKEFPPEKNEPWALVRLIINVRVRLTGFGEVDLRGKFVRTSQSIHFGRANEQVEIAPVTM